MAVLAIPRRWSPSGPTLPVSHSRNYWTSNSRNGSMPLMRSMPSQLLSTRNFAKGLSLPIPKIDRGKKLNDLLDIISLTKTYRAINSLVRFVQPILDWIALVTGFKVSLFAGGPEPARQGRLSLIRYVLALFLFCAR